MRFLPLLACLALCSCARDPKPVIYSGLASAPYLARNAGKDQSWRPFKYEPPVNWKNYSRTRVESVEIHGGADAQFMKISAEEKAELASYMATRFSASLAARDRVVPTRGSGSLRVKLTLAGAKKNIPVLGVVSRLSYLGAGYNAVQGARGKKGSNSGHVVYAIEVTDARSGELLYASIEKQYPNAIDITALVRALDTPKAGIRKGAEELSDQLR